MEKENLSSETAISPELRDKSTGRRNNTLVHYLSLFALLTVNVVTIAVLVNHHVQGIETVTGNIFSPFGLTGWQLAVDVGIGIVVPATIIGTAFREPHYPLIGISFYLGLMFCSFLPLVALAGLIAILTGLSSSVAVLGAFAGAYILPFVLGGGFLILEGTGKMDGAVRIKRRTLNTLEDLGGGVYLFFRNTVKPIRDRFLPDTDIFAYGFELWFVFDIVLRFAFDVSGGIYATPFSTSSLIGRGVFLGGCIGAVWLISVTSYVEKIHVPSIGFSSKEWIVLGIGFVALSYGSQVWGGTIRGLVINGGGVAFIILVCTDVLHRVQERSAPDEGEEERT